MTGVQPYRGTVVLQALLACETRGDIKARGVLLAATRKRMSDDLIILVRADQQLTRHQRRTEQGPSLVIQQKIYCLFNKLFIISLARARCFPECQEDINGILTPRLN